MPAHSPSLLGIIAIVAAVSAAAVLIAHLVKKPALDVRTKVRLFLGLAVLPTVTGTATTADGMHSTTEREFCGSCHVMGRHASDAKDGESQSLAARHSRNPYFGAQSCYVCHADYGMLGYPMTKLNGMRHVHEYYLGGFRSMTLEEALPKIHLRKPYDNTNCRQCHTGTLKHWGEIPEHVSLEKELAENRVSCTSSGCHGYAHPFTKPDGDQAHSPPRPWLPIPPSSASATQKR